MNNLVQVMAVDTCVRQLVYQGVVQRVVSVDNKFYSDFGDDSGYRDLTYHLLFNGSIVQLVVEVG